MRKFCLTRELEFPKCKISENFTYFCKFINGDCLEVVQRKPGFSKSQLVFFLWNSRSLSILMKIKIYYIFTFPAFDFLNFSLHEKKELIVNMLQNRFTRLALVKNFRTLTVIRIRYENFPVILDTFAARMKEKYR